MRCVRLLAYHVIALYLLSISGLAQCGGTERWAVKDGTDPSAGNIDLNPADAELISIDQLLQIDAPKGPKLPPRNDNRTRLPDEAHLYRVQARLVQWKEEAGETGDSDYHLVLTDDTLNYTQGGTKNRPTGHSFVGEIPDPQCLKGATGEFGDQSPFLPADGSAQLSIANARSELEAQFPNAATDGSWNDGGGIPVEIIGVGYFDFAHGQVGRAPNNIEIHPILSIAFPGAGTEFASMRVPTNATVRASTGTGVRTTANAPVNRPAPESGTTWQYTVISADSADKLVTNANVLGGEGWEMISVVIDVKRPGAYVGYLKRLVKR
jgi:hypothetical protein